VTGCAASPATATTTISNRTITNVRIPAGTHDLVYDHVTFKGGSSARAVLQIGNACHDIVFSDCVIASGPSNGISINDHNGSIYNITFLRCRILPQKRMGLECTSRPVSATAGYHGVQVLSCVFEPQGSEAVSFDGGTGCVDNVVDGTVIKGAGTNRAQPYGAGFELNGPSRFSFTNNHVYQCRGALLNLKRSATADSGWLFSGNVLDASQRYQKTPMDTLAQVVCGDGVWGGSFPANTVIAHSPGGGVAWFGDCHGMDWRTTSWSDKRGGPYARPMQQQGSDKNLL
jgi:hypothetical protein